MNFFRRRLGAKEAPDDGPQLYHLRKLFLDYLHPNEFSATEQQELKLYPMLPLFLNVFGETNALQMSDRFSDVLQFAGHTSKLLVIEISKRTNNKTSQRAANDVLDFLIRKPNQQENSGFNLLSTLNVLSMGEVAIIECMVAASLPSTFVYVLKLFFSLRVCYLGEDSLNEIQKLITSTFSKLCTYQVTAKELIRRNDLAMLFDALTCSCDPSHLLWRSGVSEVLNAITRNCLTKEVVEYIEEKRCIYISIANIKSMCAKNPVAIVEMLVTLICVLRDSAEVSPVLLNHFKEYGGYKFLSTLLVDFYDSDDFAVNDTSRNLVILISSLALSGHEPIQVPSSMDAPFQLAGFSIPTPTSGSGLTVKNLDAFKVLQETFLQSKDQDLCLHILHELQNIYDSDNSNFFALSSLHTLTQFIEKAPTKAKIVQSEIFKLIEFVALQLNWVPTQELMALGILFKNRDFRQCQTVALHTLIRLVNQNDNYKEIFREVGLLEVLINALKEFHDQLKEVYGVSAKEFGDFESKENDEMMTDFSFLLMECLRLLIESNKENARFFRQFRGADCAHNLIPFQCARPYTLKIIQQLIVDGSHDDLSAVLIRMHTTNKTAVRLKTDILNSMLRIFSMNAQTRTIFQEESGFVYVIAVLVSLEGSLADPAIGCWGNVSRTAVLELIWTIFQVLTASMKDEPRNRVIFIDEVRFKGLTETLKLLGCFSTLRSELPPVLNQKYSPVSCLNQRPLPKISRRSSKDYMKMVVFKCLMSMASSSFENWDMDDDELRARTSESPKMLRIVHPGAIGAVVELLPSLWEDDGSCVETVKDLPNALVNVISQLQQILGSDQSQQILCESGLPLLLLSKCKEAFMDDDNPLNAALTKMFERLTSQSVAPDVLRDFLRLGSPLCCSSSYAMLRPVSRDRGLPDGQLDTNDKHAVLNDSLDGRNKKRAMSLRIYDGDIQLSCGSRRSTFIEEKEIDFDESTDGTSKLTADSNENKPVDSISVSSELDREVEASDLSADSSTSRAGLSVIEGEDLSSEYQLDHEQEDSAADGSSLGTEASLASDISSESTIINASGKMIEDDKISGVATENSDAAAIGVDTSEQRVCGKVNGGSQKENPFSVENGDLSVKEVVGEKKLGKDSHYSENATRYLYQDEKENMVVKPEDMQRKALHKEEESEEKPAGVKNLLEEDDTKTERLSKRSETNKEVSRISSIGQMKRCNSGRSAMSSMWASNDNEDPEKDEAIMFFEAELSRSRDKLEGEPPSQNVIKCLVSLTTPRDLLSVLSCEQPAFVEFDMNHEGFGFLFVANLTPVVTQDVRGAVLNDININRTTGPIGAVSSGERAFPPAIGLTFAAWVFIEKFPDPKSSKFLRLFCIQRRWISGQPGTRYSMVVFGIFLDFQTKNIVVTTDNEYEHSNQHSSRKASGELHANIEEIFLEGNWNHICVVLNKSVVRRSTASVYANGRCIVSTSRFRYIDARLPSGYDITSVKTCAFFGTHETQRATTDVLWRLGPSFLIEDPLVDETVSTIYKLGPSYSGCFQAPVISEHYEEIANDEPSSTLIPEEKVIFMLNARNLSTLTLAQLKHQCYPSEIKSVADETSISEDDKFTPVSVIHNSSLYFQGPSRPFGAVIIGARAFYPNDVASAIMSVGGMPILLSLVAMSKNLEELYASLKALTCIVQSSKLARKEMVRIKGYQILAFLLKRKNDLLNTHILHLIFSLVGTVRSDRELGSIPNVVAFNDLLCDFEVCIRSSSLLSFSSTLPYLFSFH